MMQFGKMRTKPGEGGRGACGRPRSGEDRPGGHGAGSSGPSGADARRGASRAWDGLGTRWQSCRSPFPPQQTREQACGAARQWSALRKTKCVGEREQGPQRGTDPCLQPARRGGHGDAPRSPPDSPSCPVSALFQGGGCMWAEGDVCKEANSSVPRTGSQYLPFKTQSGKWKLAVGDARPWGCFTAGGGRRKRHWM